MKKAVPFLIPLITVIFAVILFRFVLIIGYVPSESMEPTIQKNSYILGVRGIHDIKTGDIIIFYHEINFSLDDILWTSTTIRKSPKE